MNNYPLFSPPEHLATRGSKNWNKKEAQEYFNWFMEIRNQRVIDFLHYIGYSLTSNLENDLIRISDIVYLFYNNADYYSIREKDGSKYLNEFGLSMAADIGLLLARELERTHSSLHWTIAKGPKNYHSYNLPVLRKFKDGEWDLIYDSIGNVHLSLNVLKAPYPWFKRYKYFLDTAL
jgi:hypothetical protein